MKLLFVLISLYFLEPVIGQEVTGHVTNGRSYIHHRVEAGESVETIGGTYGLPVAAVLEINELQPGAEITPGKMLKIPIATIIQASCDTGNCIKVYYQVQASEGLYRVGKNHGDIKVAELKRLNGLSSESVSLGQRLLVGYLLLGDAIKPGGNRESAGDVRPQVSEIPANVTNVAEPTVPAKVIADSTAPAVPASFFQDQYSPLGKNDTYLASGFKSESGWSDGKFYVLINRVPVGTILKIENRWGATIYAKVLGALPAIKHLDKINLRISSAGARALQLGNEETAEVTVSY